MYSPPQKRRLQTSATSCVCWIFCRWRRLMTGWRTGMDPGKMEALGPILRAGQGDRKSGHLSHRDSPVRCRPPEGFDRVQGTVARGGGPGVDRVLTMTCDGRACRRLWWESVTAPTAEGRRGGGGRSGGIGPSRGGFVPRAYPSRTDLSFLARPGPPRAGARDRRPSRRRPARGDHLRGDAGRSRAPPGNALAHRQRILRPPQA